MMLITVAEALKLGALKKCKLIAGASCIDNEIKYVDTMEVPDIAPWLKSKELLITTGYSIKNDQTALVRLIESLKAVNAAGLAIKTRFFGQITDEVIELGNIIGLPLIEIPAEVPFIEITHPIMKAIVSRQTRHLEFSEKVHRTLTKVELEGNGFNDIAETLFSLIGNPVIITDKNFKVISMAGSNPLMGIPIDNAEEKGSIIINLSNEQIQKLQQKIGNEWLEFLGYDWKVCTRQSKIKEKVCGFTFVIEKEKPLRDMELIALEHATTTISLEFAKQEVVKEHLKLIQNDFFIDLLMGNVRTTEEATQRAQLLRWPSGPWLLINYDIDNFEEAITKKNSEAEIQVIKDEIIETISYVLERERVDFALLANSDSFTCLFAHSKLKNKNLQGIICKIQSAVLSRKKVTLSAGVSSVFSELLTLGENYQETRTSLRISRLIQGKGSIGFMEDLILERAFLDLKDNPYLHRYFLKTINKLEKYDIQANNNLINTVEVLVSNMGLRSKTAQDLFLHRNTLAYRIKKIEELTGLNLSRSDELINLAIALKIRHFL